MIESFLLRLLGSAIVALLVKGVVAATGHSIAWVWAALIGLVVVYGGFLILSGDVID